MTGRITKKLKNRFAKDSIGFAYVMCGKELTEYQEKVLLDDSRRIIVCAGRQVGKSTVISMKALWKAWCFDKQDIMITAPTERQAEIVYEKIYETISANPVMYNDTSKFTMRETKFRNGSVIRCLPSGYTGDTIRGYTCDMIIVDEAQSVPDDVFVSIIPAVMVKGGQMILLGTPGRGRTGYFWQAWNDSEWSKHRVTSYESPFIEKEEIESFRKVKGEVAFKREIMAEFIDADDMFFDLNVIDELAVLTKKSKPKAGWRYYCGIDWARYGNDYNSVVMVGVHPDEEQYQMHGFWIRGKKPLTDIIGWAVKLISKWRPRVVVADATSGWGAAVDRLRERLYELDLGVEVRDFNFSKQSMRKEMYWNLRRLLDDRKLLLIKNDTLFSQFESYRVRYSSNGQEMIKKEGKNDDIVDALALACWGISSSGLEWKVADFIDVDVVARESFNRSWY